MGEILESLVISENPLNSPTDKWSTRLWTLAIVFLLIKLAIGSFLPLTADESYYWVWSQKIDYGYFDHPPMIAWLFYLGNFLSPLGGIRWPAIILGHFSFALWVLILKDLFPTKHLFLWALLFFSCPLTGLGGIVATPDIPLLFFFSLGLYCIKRIYSSVDGRWHLFLGVSLGLGFLSKYHIVLLPLSLLPLLFYSESRSRLFSPSIFLTFLAGLLTCAPVLGWNATHDWISFKFQLNHGLKDESTTLRFVGEYLLGQILLIFPPVLWAAVRNTNQKNFGRALYWAGWGPLLFFLSTSVRAPVEMNWSLIALPPIFALAVPKLNPVGFRASLTFWLAIQATLIIGVFFPNRFPIHEKLAEPTRFRIVAELPQKYKPLFGSSYQIASSLWYVSGIPVYKLAGMSRIDMFDYWKESSVPESSFYLLRETGQTLPDRLLNRSMTVIESPAPGLELVRVNK